MNMKVSGSVAISFSNQEEFEEAKAQLLDPKTSGGWLTVGYSSPLTLVMQGHGDGGVEELLNSLDDSQIQYIMFRLSAPVDGVAKNATKDVFINWIGPKVGGLEKGKKRLYVDTVQQMFKPYHCALEAVGRRTFNEKTIRERIGHYGGSHTID